MVQFNKRDKPNKYGETRKMIAINDLVESEKTLEDAWFELNEEDKEYYESKKWMYDLLKEANGGKKPIILHYFNE